MSVLILKQQYPSPCGRLGFGNHWPVPSCVVARIRPKFPEPDGKYNGNHEALEALREWQDIVDNGYLIESLGRFKIR